MKHAFTFWVEPVPASRPRVSRWGTYYLKRYKDFKAQAKACIKQELSPEWEPLDSHLKITATFKPERPKTTKLDKPKADIDNYVKALFDAGNGLLWTDDYLIDLVIAEKEWAPEGCLGHILLGIELLD